MTARKEKATAPKKRRAAHARRAAARTRRANERMAASASSPAPSASESPDAATVRMRGRVLDVPRYAKETCGILSHAIAAQGASGEVARLARRAVDRATEQSPYIPGGDSEQTPKGDLERQRSILRTAIAGVMDGWPL